MHHRLRRSQDYRSPGSKLHKDWLEEGTFDEMPPEYFRQYDQMRMALADEVMQVVEDSLVETHMGQLLKRVQPLDLTLLGLIQSRGVVRVRDIQKEISDAAKLAVTRCKARGLIIPVRLGPNYNKYDITDLGAELLKEHRRLDKERKVPELIVPTRV